MTGTYERVRGLRDVGEHDNGFAITVSRTVDVPVERLYDAFVDDTLREHWLPDSTLRTRTATKPKSARFDWDDGRTRVIVEFAAKGDAKSRLALRHERLTDAESADQMKAFWRERIAILAQQLVSSSA